MKRLYLTLDDRLFENMLKLKERHSSNKPSSRKS